MIRKIIYPGTFDPIHNGHIDIATRAAKLFDSLEFVVADNSEKNPLFSGDERSQLISDSTQHIENIKVSQFKGLVVNHAKNSNAIAIIRGLRHVSDFEFEFQMAMMNFHLDPDIASLFMMPDEKYIHLNSTVVKDVVKNGGDISAFVPIGVNKALLSKYSQ
ncbi:MAG: pantetheine-phosphate adenylyltransferase [Candidatus Marinimicrobia bacterium]|nr:pantetheine-phosphate adenylyltransferase [Candidatus Neomarinimicrobiota bacterium]MBT3501092.1 pantetheine-phosphate adenylyltransferase [Candidatus Neomarinimicrobiota bacterium]MBT3838957.1 pantetheine-phosphate adenylyltransferase [Candidatus Neomarinimicrobiota bacterium]MBT4000221.1 pantetheine-phosphate adenylyltransferase [Candidatus Neomarinimicrobiota bacterium]MBT4282018.1 pantetheine-phosphate adenylyltransferase [Candidatus Neomarinimicrobiota bacterium]